MKYDFYLFKHDGILDPEKADEKGTYIGELTHPDEIAEELVRSFPRWKDSDKLLLARDGKIRNFTTLYRVKNWRKVESESKWFTRTEANQSKHHRLFIRHNKNGAWAQTDYFIDEAGKSYQRIRGHKYALHISGAHPSGIAEFIQGSNRITELKKVAETMHKDN